MQRSSFIKSILITTTIITMPIMCMELASDTPEIPKFIVTLHLHKASERASNNPYNQLFDEDDKHICKVLGIKWEENKNTYWTNKALFKKAGDNKDFCCWKNCHPKGLPFSTIANSSFKESFQYTVKFPTSLPDSFVEKLKQEKSITLTDTLFAEPVEIILKLESIENDSDNVQLKINTLKTSVNALLEEFHSTRTEVLQSTERTTSYKTYFFTGIAATGIIVFIAWLLHKNNRLDFSQIINFMHSLQAKNN